MSEIILKCINHVTSLVNTPDITSGNVNYDTVLFELCPNWTGFTKTAVFYRSEDEVYYQILDNENRCTIPKEVLQSKGKIRIGLFGVKDNKTITSDVVTYSVLEGAITTALKPSDLTPDIYAQLLGQYSNLGAEIDLERKRIDSIVAGSTADANAELRDIRIGADGTVYGSAGDAVRSQFKMIKEVNALAIANEASGKEIIVTDSSDNEFKNLKVYGETTQRLGKNRIKCDASFIGNIIDGITYKGEYETPIGEGELQYIEVSGKFEPLNMDGGTTASSTSRTIGEATLSAGEYIFSQGYATTSLTPYLVLYLDGVRSSDLSTVGQTEKSIKLTKSTVVRLDIEVRVASGTTITTTKVYPMIRLASETDGTYEPYNGVDPSPESPQPIESKVVNRVDVSGKNSLDSSRYTTKTSNGITFTPKFDSNGNLEYITANGTATADSYYTIIEKTNVPQEALVLNGCEGGSASIYSLLITYRNEDDTYADQAFQSQADTDLLIDTSKKIYSVTIFVKSGATVNNVRIYPMLRPKGTDATYEPYKGKQTVSLSAPIELNGIGGVRDTIEIYADGSGKHIQRVGKTTIAELNGGYNGSNFWFTPTDKAIGKTNLLCTCYTVVSDSISNHDQAIGGDVNTSNLFIMDKNHTTYESLINAVGNELIYYALTTPIETALSQVDINALRSLHTYKPTTILTNDAGADMTLEYVADTKLYIDKRISELATAILNN